MQADIARFTIITTHILEPQLYRRCAPCSSTTPARKPKRQTTQTCTQHARRRAKQTKADRPLEVTRDFWITRSSLLRWRKRPRVPPRPWTITSRMDGSKTSSSKKCTIMRTISPSTTATHNTITYPTRPTMYSNKSTSYTINNASSVANAKSSRRISARRASSTLFASTPAHAHSSREYGYLQKHTSDIALRFVIMLLANVRQ